MSKAKGRAARARKRSKGTRFTPKRLDPDDPRRQLVGVKIAQHLKHHGSWRGHLQGRHVELTRDPATGHVSARYLDGKGGPRDGEDGHAAVGFAVALLGAAVVIVLVLTLGALALSLLGRSW